MNYKMIRYILGVIMVFEAVFMLLPSLVAVVYAEKEGLSFLITIAVCLAVGALFIVKKPSDKSFYAKEGFVVVALSWILLSVFGAMPFVISGSVPNYIDALFETVSGFTTTGASILTDVEIMPRCILFWRSFTHWIGGMGVLVFVMAIMPLAGGGNAMYLMKAESPGPNVSKLVPKVRTTAFILYSIYCGISLFEFIALIISRMPVYDALVITFGTAGTGGFAVLNDSIASYTGVQQIIITIFMVMFGINFNVYYLLGQRKFKPVIKNSELKAYITILVLATAVITLNTYHYFDSIGEAIKQSAFQVASVMTTTGFSTVDFNEWNTLCKTILVLLMFVGACAGSTGGGIKVSRFVILFKTIRKELDFVIHPHNIKKISVDGKKIDHTVLRNVNVYMMCYILIFALSMLLVSVDDFGTTTNFTAVAATLNNIGPGLELVGPAGNYSQFSSFSKIVLIFDMLAGRLELYPILLLFFRRTWSKN